MSSDFNPTVNPMQCVAAECYCCSWCCRMHSMTPASDMCWICTFFLSLSQPLIILKDNICSCVLFYIVLSLLLFLHVSQSVFLIYLFLFMMPVILLLIISLFLFPLNHLRYSRFIRNHSLLCSCVSHLILTTCLYVPWCDFWNPPYHLLCLPVLSLLDCDKSD